MSQTWRFSGRAHILWCMELQVKANARAIGAKLSQLGYKLVTDGTDNHLVMWDLRPEVGSSRRMMEGLISSS